MPERKVLEPIIVSASRETDLPRYYFDWFLSRLEAGGCQWKNSFNGQVYDVSFAKTRAIVFWSKNPAPVLETHSGGETTRLQKLEALGFRNYYFQFTLNDYDRERLEPNVPDVLARIGTFKRLVDVIGFGRVVWRFDPLVLAKGVDLDELQERVGKIGDALKGYTEKLVFSYVDIEGYRKVSTNLAGLGCREFSPTERLQFAQSLVKLNERWNYVLATCGEECDLPGIEHNRCVDDQLMKRLFSSDYDLMTYFGGEQQLDGSWYFPDAKKDKGQRKSCGCVASKDIGMYNTCPHLCRYCYANANDSQVLSNWSRHKSNPCGPMIVM